MIAPRLAVTLVVVLAVVARAVRWTEGLPHFLAEAQPLRIALRLWTGPGEIDWNPHFFVYPSLAIYLHFAAQSLHLAVGGFTDAYGGLGDFLLGFVTDPTAHVVVARALATALDALTVLATIRIGEGLARGAGIAAGAVVALAPTFADTSLALYVEGPLAAATAWALERMLAHLKRGDIGSLAAAAALTGLAASCKYPGALLVLPLGAAALLARGIRAPRGAARAAGAWALAFAAFAITSPYVLIEWERAAADLDFASALARRGHLGHLEQPAAGFYAALLARDPGWLVLGLAAAAPALAWRDPEARRAAIVLGLAAAPLLASVALSSVIAPRYVVAIVPVLAALAGFAAAWVVARVPRLPATARVATACAVLLLAVAPAVRGAVTRPARDTRVIALEWCAAHLDPRLVIAQESGGPPMLPVSRKTLVESSAMYAQAGAAARARYRGLREYNVVAWPLFVHGDLRANVAAPGVPPRWVEVLPEASDFNGVFYDLALLAYADVVITSGIVRSRYAADSVRFAAPVRAYRALDREAETLARFDPEPGVDGPEIRIYRVTPATRARWLAEHGPLDADRWLGAVPPGAEIRRSAAAGGLRPDGRPAWAAPLGAFFAQHVEPTYGLMAQAVAHAGRPEDAAALARARDAWR